MNIQAAPSICEDLPLTALQVRETKAERVGGEWNERNKQTVEGK